MKAVVQRICLSVLACGISCIGMPLLPAKEFLTPKEIEKIQEAQELDKRVKLYLDAAALRLKTVEERFRGQESNPGDPLEFFSIEEMLVVWFMLSERKRFSRGRPLSRVGQRILFSPM